MSPEQVVVNLIALHNDKPVERTRLQREAYLLNRCGGNFDISFVYYKYSPYSPALDEGIIDALTMGHVETEWRTGRYSIKHVLFKIKDTKMQPENLGKLPADKALDLLRKMNGDTSDTVLEIAAAIVFFRDEGRGRDHNQAVEETRLRKSIKATNERIEEAISLLRDLGLHRDDPGIGDPGLGPGASIPRPR